MSARVWFVVGARLLGLWLLVDALLSLSAAFPFPMMPEGVPFPVAHPAHAVVQAILAVVLIVTATRLAFLVPAGLAPERELGGAGVVLIGIAVLIGALSSLLALVFMPLGTMPWRVYVEPLAGLVIGLFLLAGPGAVARWISRD